jgi:hypothetical protein
MLPAVKYPCPRVSLAIFAAIAAIFVTPLCADDFAPEPGFVALFNGRDFSGWHHKDGPPLDGRADSGDGRYAIHDGAMSANDAKAGKGRVLLWTTRGFTGDFVLRFEFRAAAKTDGGVFFNKTQLQCGDYSSYAYKTFAAYRPQDWNAIEVSVRDGVARCTCNGEVLEAALKIPEPGEIGFEADKGAIEYRRIRIQISPTDQ